MSAAPSDSDLSPYERARLANIARNRAMLQQLGLADASPQTPHAKAPFQSALAQAFSPSTVRKAKREARPPADTDGVRRSMRLLAAALPDDAAHVQASAAHGLTDAGDDAVVVLDYEDKEIMLPEQLDDFEFELYTMLRAWRLQTCRPLDLEPYKIFQNRTLVEAVRRRRSDSSWGSTQQQLLECWGIGPVKVQPPGAPPLHCDARAGARGRVRVAAHRANAAACRYPAPPVLARQRGAGHRSGSGSGFRARLPVASASRNCKRPRGRVAPRHRQAPARPRRSRTCCCPPACRQGHALACCCIAIVMRARWVQLQRISLLHFTCTIYLTQSCCFNVSP
jgi:hypothetical protein